MTSQHRLSDAQYSDVSVDTSRAPDGTQQTNVEPGTDEDAPNVTVVSTPDDGSCGIGTYTGDLLDAFPDSVETTKFTYDQDDRSVGHFLALAVRSMLADGDIVHVQHEYGLFRRDDSPWPGVMGLVFFPVLFALNGFVGKSIVTTMHSVLEPDPDEAPLRVRLYLLLMHALVASGSDHVIFLSEQCARRFRENVHLDPETYSVLPHGVNVSDASDRSTAASKEWLGYDPDDEVVMIPGFVRPPKGHDVFVEVARELPAYEFLVAGGGRPKGEDLDYAERIEDEAPENVTVTGILDEDEFPTALNAADLALLPYRVVTQSGTFNWCAAHEIPVVASDEQYFVNVEREWGCVETVDIEDRDAIIEEVRRLVNADEEREALAERMREYKLANSFERVARMHRLIYEIESDREEIDVGATPTYAEGAS